MTKLLKKSLAVVLSVALCLSVMVCGFVASADGEPTITLVADNATPAAGDTVKIDVKVANFDAVAGAQFTVDLGGLEYVSVASDAIEDIDAFTNVVDGDVRLVNEYMNDADAGYVDISAANGVLFTITATVPADAAAETAYTVAIADAKFCEGGEGEPEVDVKAESVTLTVPAEEVDLTDPALGSAFSVFLGITDKIGYAFQFVLPNTYDDFEITMVRTVVGDGYALDTETTVFNKTNTVMNAGTLYLYTYVGVAVYELSADTVVTINGLKNGEIAGTYTTEFTMAERLINTYNTNAGSTDEVTLDKNDMYAELLWLGDAALTRFQNTQPDTGICELASPIVGFDVEKTTGYTPVEDTTTSSGATWQLYLGVAPNPSIAYMIMGLNSDVVANGKLVATYESKELGTIDSGELSLKDSSEKMIAGQGYNLFTFDSIALYDSDKLITVNVYDADNAVVASHTTSLAMRLSAALNGVLDDDARELYERVLIFGDAARVVFEAE